MDRVKIWFELFLRPAYRWLVLAPLAILGTAQALRDEFLPANVADQYRALDYAPDWPWEWYAIAALSVIVFLVLESAYRLIRADRKMISGLNDELPFSLVFVGPHLRFGTHHKNKDRKTKSTVIVAIGFKNSGKKPLRYEIRDFQYAFGDGEYIDGNLSNRGAVIGPGAETRFTFPGRQKIDETQLSLSGKISYTVQYGIGMTAFSFWERHEMVVTCGKSVRTLRGYDVINYTTTSHEYGSLDGPRQTPLT